MGDKPVDIPRAGKTVSSTGSSGREGGREEERGKGKREGEKGERRKDGGSNNYNNHCSSSDGSSVQV